jgi:serine/threonine protein kinase
MLFKIGDFGSSKILQSNARTHSITGTIEYMPHEGFVYIYIERERVHVITKLKCFMMKR